MFAGLIYFNLPILGHCHKRREPTYAVNYLFPKWELLDDSSSLCYGHTQHLPAGTPSASLHLNETAASAA